MARCAICRAGFERRSISSKTCGEAICKAELKRQTERKKAERESIKRRKEAIKPLKEYRKDAAKAVRDYVRARDEGKECISCSKILIKTGAPGGDYDAGHYRGVGRAKHLELVEMNQNGQCKHCNRDHNGSYHEQRPKMIARYGLEAVEAIEADQEPRKYTRQDLQAIEVQYKAKLKAL